MQQYKAPIHYTLHGTVLSIYWMETQHIGLHCKDAVADEEASSVGGGSDKRLPASPAMSAVLDTKARSDNTCTDLPCSHALDILFLNIQTPVRPRTTAAGHAKQSPRRIRSPSRLAQCQPMNAILSHRADVQIMQALLSPATCTFLAKLRSHG